MRALSSDDSPFRDDAVFEIMPQRDHQSPGQRGDRDASDFARCVGHPLLVTFAER